MRPCEHFLVRVRVHGLTQRRKNDWFVREADDKISELSLALSVTLPATNTVQMGDVATWTQLGTEFQEI